MQDKRKAGYTYMFNFRIITTADGNQIIDRNLKTPYEALTPTQMLEYMEMDNSLAFMDMVERKAKQKAEQTRKLDNSIFSNMRKVNQGKKEEVYKNHEALICIGKRIVSFLIYDEYNAKMIEAVKTLND